MASGQSHDAAQIASIAWYFSSMDDAVLSARGRLLVEVDAPHFVTQSDGGASRILGANASRITSRRIKAICRMPDDGDNLARACHAVCQLPTLRAYMSIATNERRVPVAVQRMEHSPGVPAIEVLLFPAEECHPLLVSGTVLASVESRPSSYSSNPPQAQSAQVDSLEKENLLQACQDPDQAELESLVGLGTASLDAITVASGGRERALELEGVTEGKLRVLGLEDKPCPEGLGKQDDDELCAGATPFKE